jgi:inosine/xanthosine triphosphatase
LIWADESDPFPPVISSIFAIFTSSRQNWKFRFFLREIGGCSKPMRRNLNLPWDLTNPVKVECVLVAAQTYWPGSEVLGVDTDSGVGHQPVSDTEMRTGAINRARGALAAIVDANMGVGIEGGVLDALEGMWACAWVAIIDRQGHIGWGQSGRFLLPAPVAALVRDGMELGLADDLFFRRGDPKQLDGAVAYSSAGPDQPALSV